MAVDKSSIDSHFITKNYKKLLRMQVLHVTIKFSICFYNMITKGGWRKILGTKGVLHEKSRACDLQYSCMDRGDHYDFYDALYDRICQYL